MVTDDFIITKFGAILDLNLNFDFSVTFDTTWDSD